MATPRPGEHEAEEGSPSQGAVELKLGSRNWSGQALVASVLGGLSSSGGEMQSGPRQKGPSNPYTWCAAQGQRRLQSTAVNRAGRMRSHSWRVAVLPSLIGHNIFPSEI